MANKKKRNVYFYSYELKSIATGEETAFSSLKDVLTWANGIEYEAKKWTKSINPTHNLYINVLESRNHNSKHLGVVTSLREKERPDVVKIPTGTKRTNPKDLDEADEELTHFGILYTNHGTIVCIENNAKAVKPEVILHYFDTLYQRYLIEHNQPRISNTLSHKLARGNFLEILRDLERVKTIHISASTAILGNSFLSFNGRVPGNAKNVDIIVNADRNESLKDYSEEIYRHYSSSRNEIEKISIIGSNSEGCVKLDSIFSQKSSELNVSVDSDTGTVNTTEMLSKISNLLDNI